MLSSVLYGKRGRALPRSRPTIAEPRYCAHCALLAGGYPHKGMLGEKVSPRSLPPLGGLQTKRDTALFPSFQAATRFVAPSRWFKAPRSKAIDCAREDAVHFVLASRKATPLVVRSTATERERLKHSDGRGKGAPVPGHRLVDPPGSSRVCQSGDIQVHKFTFPMD